MSGVKVLPEDIVGGEVEALPAPTVDVEIEVLPTSTANEVSESAANIHNE